MIILKAQPEVPPMSWEQFCATAPAFSIALDGYVAAGPQFDVKGPVVNFNHHEGCDRLATRATCAQVLMAIRQGLFDLFRDHKGPKATIFVNDCDEDVCTSWYLLKNHWWSKEPLNPLLNRLVTLEDALDSTAGAYPYPADLPALRYMAWIFAPYRQFRLSGEIDKKDPYAHYCLIEDVENRISRHVTGNGGEQALDTRYERIGGGTGWVMVKEVGAQARTGMFSDGIRAYVSVRERPDGAWTYVLGRLSPFVPFDVEGLTDLFNTAEKTSTDRWGGASNVAGSPRVCGSKLNPAELTELIEEHIKSKR